MSLKDIPDKIIGQYNLGKMVSDNWVYMQIETSMSGLKQAGKIANNKLKSHMILHGYTPVPRTLELRRYVTRSIIFTLVVDNFGIRYSSAHDANHLINTLKELYEITTDWSGQLYCDITLN